MAHKKVTLSQFEEMLRKAALERSKNPFVLATRRIMNYVIMIAQTKYLSGQVLKVQTGRLRSSLELSIDREGKDITTGRVGTRVHYGRAWEFGFHVPEYIIRPKRKKALHFFIGGEEFFRKKVRIPAHDVKARPWLRPAIEESRPFIMQELAKANMFMRNQGGETGGG